MQRTEPYVEIREYTHTIEMFFDADGNVVGEQPRMDDTHSDTLETRPMTDEEREGWL